MLQAFPRSSAWLLSLLVVMVLLLAPTANGSAQAAVTDTPVPVVLDNSVEEWTVGAGLIYWGHNCFADEFTDSAELKRKPVSGATVRTLQTLNDFERCNTYLNMLSSGDGLYYFESSDTGGRILRMPLGEPYEPQEVKVLANAQTPNFRIPFVEADGYLYWAHASPPYTILRTLKDGSGEVETVADTVASFPGDIIVVGTNVYWTDSEGVWSRSVDCEELPCASGAKFDDFSDNEIAHGLIYQLIEGSAPFFQDSYRIYWVVHIGSSYAIHYRSCSFQFQCFFEVAPGPGPQPEPDPPLTFYEAAPNWWIGDPVLANGNLFWTEGETAVGTSTDEVKRKAYDAPLDTAPDTIATGQEDVDDQLYIANNALFFAREGTGGGIFTLPLDATPITRDFDLEAMEVTQAIQNLANGVPLVAEKTTYVRAYAKQVDGPSTPNVEARLVGTRGGNALPGSPLKPVNGVRALTNGAGYDRAKLSDGWYFLLPESWTDAGTIELQMTVDPRHLHTDPTLDNNQLAKTVSFQDQPPVCVWTVPVRTHTPLPSTNDPNFWTMVSHFDRRWPVPETWIFRDTDPVEELQVCWYGPFPHPCHGPYELSDGWGITNGIPDRDKVIVSLWGRALLSFNPDACDDNGAPVHFMGMVHPTADNGGAAGYASTISNQSWVQLPPHTPVASGWNMLDEGETMAQELAHNHGRKHVNCNNPDNIDNNYPYPPCQIANTGADSFYGFDATTRQPIRPDQASDFMSYGGGRWVSDYTWKSLLNKFVTARIAAAAPTAADQGESVFVTGLVDTANNRGEISLVLILPAASLPPETRQMVNVQTAAIQHDNAPHADYKLRLLDPDGTQVHEEPLTLAPLDDHSDESDAALFSALFPKPAQQVATIQLLADSTVISSVTAGVNLPTVSVQQPESGAVIEETLTIQWTASDADAAPQVARTEQEEGDDLLFTVQYSHDNGASWHTLAVNLPSTPADPVSTLTLNDLGTLHGSANNAARIRVLASDGYNTAIAESDPFTVQNRPPEPAIIAPANGQTLAGGEAVLLQGTAIDAEDGGLGDDALAWQVDGVDVGSGSVRTVDGLASGEHTALFSATDANNQTVTTSASFNLAPLTVPQSADPVLDGVCTDVSYTEGINLQLRPYGDDSQATVHLVRSDEYLWACFSTLKLGEELPGAYAGLRVDINNSRDPLAQASDVGFFVGEDGSVFTRAGDGEGDLVAPGPGGLQGQVTTGASGWNAELRIEKAAVGDWNHLVGLALGHHAVEAADDDYAWPYTAQWDKPATWSPAALGIQPLLTAIDPFSATVQGPSVTLSVTGRSFISGTQVLWNESALPTTFVDSEHLTAEVPAANLDTAAIAQVATRSPDNFVSNALPFVVEAMPPVITSLSPISVTAGNPTMLLTLHGSNFAPDAQVLWNGTALTTQFVDATQLTVQVDATLLENGQSVGIAVSNPTPSAQISSAATFEVQPDIEEPDEEDPDEEDPDGQKSYLPGLFK